MPASTSITTHVPIPEAVGKGDYLGWISSCFPSRQDISEQATAFHAKLQIDA